MRSILDIVHDNKTLLDYNDNLEIILDGGQPIAGSNIVNILLYLTGNVPVTSDKDIPEGTHELYDRLIQLGMPSVWIKPKRQKRQRASSRLAEKTKKRRKVQQNEDLKWESI